MLDLAKHIIATKRGQFDPSAFHDRYEMRARRTGPRQARGQADQAEEARCSRQGRRPDGCPASKRWRSGGREGEASWQAARRSKSKAASGRPKTSETTGARRNARQVDGMALAAYRKKRDFAATSEPRGKRPKAQGGNSYLIQKHAARRLHYDLRLEMDGVLKSWAVTRGPSLVAGEKRLAVHVEDHPLEYGDFEGTIPKGEYGGGTVIVWDRGSWEPIGDPHKGLAKGHLEFELHGREAQAAAGIWSGIAASRARSARTGC